MLQFSSTVLSTLSPYLTAHDKALYKSIITSIHSCYYIQIFYYSVGDLLLLHTHTHTRPFNGLWSGTTRVGRYQKELSPTHTYPNQRASFITFLHLQRSMASSLFNLCGWQSSRTTSFQVFFGLPLGLEPSTSCSIHFFTQSSSSFRNTRPYQRSLFCCNTNMQTLLLLLLLPPFDGLFSRTTWVRR